MFKIDNTYNEIVSQLTNIIGNTMGFIDKVKIIFQQKGFVASGLKATVEVNKVPLVFSF